MDVINPALRSADMQSATVEVNLTPAQAAGVDSRLWEISDMVKMIEEWEAKNASA